MVIVRVPLSDIIHSGSLSLTLYNSFIVCSVHQEVVEVVGLKILCARRPVEKICYGIFNWKIRDETNKKSLHNIN